jgi:hypothetical protein
MVLRNGVQALLVCTFLLLTPFLTGCLSEEVSGGFDEGSVGSPTVPTTPLLPPGNSANFINVNGNNISINEGESITINLNFDRPIEEDGTVNYTILGGGSDFVSNVGVVDIPSGAATLSFDLTSVDDTLFEGSEQFFINIEGQPPAFDDTLVLPITLLETSTQPTAQFAIASQNVFEGDGSINVLVQLSKPAGQDMSIPLTLSGSAVDGLDYYAPATFATIPQGASSNNFTIILNDDPFAEATEDIVITMGAPASGLAMVNGAANTHTINLQDNENVLSFAVEGVTGDFDTTTDAFLVGGFVPTVHWGDRSGEASYDVTIYQNDGSTVQCPTVTKVANSTSHTFTGCVLTDTLTYQVEVIADVAGPSPATNNNFSFVVDNAPPAAFSILGVTGGTDVAQDTSLADGDIATIHWVDSADEASYGITIYEADGTTVRCPEQTTGQNITSHQVVGCSLAPGNNYQAEVVAYDAGFNSGAASNAPFQFFVGLPDPSGLTVAGTTSSTISLSWTPTAGTNVNGYVIAYTEGSTAPADCRTGTIIDSPSISGTSHVVEFLTQNTQYSFRVCTEAISPVGALSGGIVAAAVTDPAVSTGVAFCNGGGTLATTCYINDTQTLNNTETLIAGGSIVIQSGGVLQTPVGEVASVELGGDFVIESGGTLRANLLPLKANNIDIQLGGTIDLAGRGHPGGITSGAGAGPGGSAGGGSSSYRGGASHAGLGALSFDGNPVGLTYGSETSPTQMGSGGGAEGNDAGGAGGGAIKLKATTHVTINGNINANGGAPADRGGAGSGGSIFVDTVSISGSGMMTANGGTATHPLAGSGGGGRIAIVTTGINRYYGQVQVEGGASALETGSGGEGTFYLSSSNPDALCDAGTVTSLCQFNGSRSFPASYELTGVNFNIASSASNIYIVGQGPGLTIDASGDVVIDAITNGDYASIHANNLTFNANILGNIKDTLVSSSLTLASTANVFADGLGYRGGQARDEDGQGPGRSLSAAGAGGAGYAGVGGDGSGSAGGLSYGSRTNPNDMGSGAAAYLGFDGGSGGGLVRLVSGGTLNLEGDITVNGTSGSGTVACCSPGSSGGGSGGGILISAGNLNGSGDLSARGGDGGAVSFSGGGGSGGRVAILVAGTYNYTGSVDVSAGNSPNFASAASEGSFYLQINSTLDLCDSGDLATTCTISTHKVISSDLVINANSLHINAFGSMTTIGDQSGVTFNLTGDLTLDGPFTGSISSLNANHVTINNTIIGNVLNANVLGDLNITASGAINADGLGYKGGTGDAENGQGPGVATASVGQVASGSGYGGVGGFGEDGAAIGGTYGSAANPVDFGSGGNAEGAYNGGDGGGLIRFVVTGHTTLDGVLQARGTNGTGASICCTDIASGGGSGGSINIQSNSLSGTGSVNVQGGQGGDNGRGEAGSGGGGRIAFNTSSSYAFRGSVNVEPGATNPSLAPAGKGSFYVGLNSLDDLCDSGDFTTTCVISSGRTLPDNINLTGNSLTTGAGASLNFVGNTDSVQINLTGDLTINGPWTGDVTQLVANDVTINNSWIGNINTSTISGDFNLTGAASIDASERGFSGGVSVDQDGSGPGASLGGTVHTSGASYGGVGQTAQSLSPQSSTYGSRTNPTQAGSGSAAASSFNGAAGGGLVYLNVTGSATINGDIYVNGGNGDGYNLCCNYYATGGGSGGAINIRASTISGTGQLMARGGEGAAIRDLAGDGAGGRVALVASTSWSFTGTVYVDGGTPTGAPMGEKGSYYISAPDYDGLCSSGNFAGTCTITQDFILPSDINITGSNMIIDTGGSIELVGIDEGAAINLTGDFTLNGSFTGTLADLHADNVTIDGTYTGNLLDSTITTNFNLTASGVMSADGWGFSGGVLLNANGEGPGASASCTDECGGAGHGGVGGQSYIFESGGPSYGTLATPETFGSGAGASGYRFGGDGGGRFKIIAGGDASINGTISARGTAGDAHNDFAAGGGSGGSIWIQSNILNGSGSVTVQGGDGSQGYEGSGSGAGGYISLNSTSGYLYTGSVNVASGTVAAEGGRAESGQFYLGLSSLDDFCDAGNFATSCIITDTLYLPRDFTITGTSWAVGVTGQIVLVGDRKNSGFTVDLTNNFDVDGTWNGDIDEAFVDNFQVSGTLHSNLFVKATSDIDIQSAAVLNANERGFRGAYHINEPGQGPGGMSTSPTSGQCGASHGGTGGLGTSCGAVTSGTYGSADLTLVKGSGGAASNFYDGGSGGGVIGLLAGGTLTLDGTISANGGSSLGNGSNWSGAGSGGSLLFYGDVITGSGSVSVNGGNGQTTHSGGGGGGRISYIYTTTHSFSGTESANGGTVTAPPATAGGAGTITTINDDLYQPIFATSTGFDATGMTASDANQTCNNFAHDRGLVGGWKAIISDNSTNASADTDLVGPFYNLRREGAGGIELVGTNRADLFDSTLSAPVSYDEYGEDVGFSAWTWSLGNGTYSANSCDLTVTGARGDPTATNGNWFGNETAATCSSLSSFYCVQR